MAVCGLAIAFALSVSEAARAEYRLAPGDTVEIALAGVPDHYRAPIQPDGSITLPGLGPVAVQGMTQADFQARMEAFLPTKIFQYRTPDGVEHPVLLKPADVTTSIAEYRPVYISGDVLTPGQQAYRPLMTVRQVVAVAGGYSVLRSRAMQGATDPVELQRDYESASVEYAKEFFHAARLQAELQGKDTLDQQISKDMSLASSTNASIVKSETESLRLARDDARAEETFFDESIKKAEAQLTVLKTQEQDEAKGVESDTQELDRASKLFSAGTIVSPRVTEARRALLLSSTRHLQTMVEVMRLQRQQDEQQHQLEKWRSQLKIKLLADLNDANVRLASISIRLQAIRQKLQPFGAAGPRPVGSDNPRLAPGGAGAGGVAASGPRPVGSDNLKPDVAIVRKVDQKWTRTEATPDTEVEPGDVIEVALHLETVASQ
jgi:polysaccharide export outer membrane protein